MTAKAPVQHSPAQSNAIRGLSTPRQGAAACPSHREAAAGTKSHGSPQRTSYIPQHARVPVFSGALKERAQPKTSSGCSPQLMSPAKNRWKSRYFVLTERPLEHDYSLLLYRSKSSKASKVEYTIELNSYVCIPPPLPGHKHPERLLCLQTVRLAPAFPSALTFSANLPPGHEQT
ncbi:hypothetical protein CYMTET_10443, partial [Cymbomonas tetramitiformis]